MGSRCFHLSLFFRYSPGALHLSVMEPGATVTVVAKIFSKLLTKGQNFQMILSPLLSDNCLGPTVLPLSFLEAWRSVPPMQWWVPKLFGKGRRQQQLPWQQTGAAVFWDMWLHETWIGKHCTSSGRETQQFKCFMRPQLSSYCLFGHLVQCWSPGSK